MIGNGRNARFAFTEIEDLSRLDQLSEQELEQLKKKVGSSVKNEEQPDLQEYRRMRTQQQQQERDQGVGLLTRIAYALGFTPERTFSKRIAQAEKLFHVYSQGCNELGELLDSQSKRIDDLNKQHAHTAQYFQVCQTQFIKKRERLDKLEAELEAADQSALTAQSYELRQQITASTIELRGLRQETNDAERSYRSARDELRLTELHNQDLSTRLSAFEKQRNSFGVMLGKWKIEQKLSVGGDQPSLKEMYELLAVEAQRMQQVLSTGVFSDGPSLDPTYEIRSGLTEDDPLVNNWHRIQGE